MHPNWEDRRPRQCIPHVRHRAGSQRRGEPRPTASLLTHPLLAGGPACSWHDGWPWPCATALAAFTAHRDLLNDSLHDTRLHHQLDECLCTRVHASAMKRGTPELGDGGELNPTQPTPHAPRVPPAPVLDWCLLEELLADVQRVEARFAAAAATTQPAGQRWRDLQAERRQQIEETVLGGLGVACGYPPAAWQVHPATVVQDYGCCELEARTSVGRTVSEQNAAYQPAHHLEMLGDAVRVEAFRQAIAEVVVAGKRVLDIGAGPFCLLSRLALQAGAWHVDAVEHSGPAAAAATALFAEECAGGSATGTRSAALTAVLDHGLGLPVAAVANAVTVGGVGGGGDGGGCTVAVETGQTLALQCDLSTEAALTGCYDVVVHEILGHVASSEGVAAAIDDLTARGLCSPAGCHFVPQAASTLIAPTERLSLSVLEQLLCYHTNGSGALQPQLKYHARHFPTAKLIAPAQPMEFIDFHHAATSGTSQLGGLHQRRLEFRTERAAVFDGLLLWLRVHFAPPSLPSDGPTAECGGENGGAAAGGAFGAASGAAAGAGARDTQIDSLEADTSWSPVYIKLVEEGVALPAGARVVVDCDVWLERTDSRYALTVLLGGGGGGGGGGDCGCSVAEAEVFFADFAWRGS